MNAIAPSASTEQQMARRLVGEFLRIHAVAPHVAVSAADMALELTASEWPDCAPIYQGAQGEADWWADFASDGMIVAMLSACLKRLARQPLAGANTRKRAMVALWNDLNEKDRAAFLQLVAPARQG